jgi:protein-S-isoprenylcysteine O-methyltransferase Ste14
VIAKLLLQTTIWIAVMGALLFAPAGTFDWPAAWVYLGTVGILGLVCGAWLARADPALLAERMHPMMQKDQPAADKAFMLLFGFVALIWFLAIGLEIRWHGARVPLPLQILGMALILISTAFVMWVMRANSFATPQVKLQTDRGHHVISTGPYAFVRHPMYTGSVLFFISAPLLLGSWWGLAMSPLFAILFAIRIHIEERTLVAGLPGYTDYTRHVRYRLLPGVW